MFNKYFLVKSYIKHFFLAKNEHSLHSPFMFEFYNECIKKKIPKEQFILIENLRKQLLKNTSEITITDFGAGSKIYKSNRRRISDIAKTSLSPKNQGELLYKIVSFLKPKTIIELGTSLGITTSYLASGYKEANVFTLEGCPSIANEAQSVFNTLHFQKNTIIIGNIDDTFPKLIDNLESVDFVFFDGNHTEKATLHYFETALKKINDKLIFSLD